MDIQASWMKTNLSERQRKKHITNFNNFTLLQNKYATIRSHVLHRKRWCVSYQFHNKNHGRHKDLVFISWWRFCYYIKTEHFCFCKQISCSNCMIVNYTNSYSFLWLGRKAWQFTQSRKGNYQCKLIHRHEVLAYSSKRNLGWDWTYWFLS